MRAHGLAHIPLLLCAYGCLQACFWIILALMCGCLTEIASSVGNSVNDLMGSQTLVVRVIRIKSHEVLLMKTERGVQTPEQVCTIITEIYRQIGNQPCKSVSIHCKASPDIEDVVTPVLFQMARYLDAEIIKYCSPSVCK